MLIAASSPLTRIIPGLMIWTLVFFAITFYVLKRFAFGRIQQILDERRERIRQAIEEADRAREEARGLLEEHRRLIGRAKSDAEEILAEASERRMREETSAERQRRIEETRRQIEAETRRALEQIRAEVVDLSLLAASKVTRKALDDEDHRRLIEEAVGELDFSVLEGDR